MRAFWNTSLKSVIPKSKFTLSENVKQLETIHILEYNKDNMYNKIVFGGKNWNLIFRLQTKKTSCIFVQ